MRVSDRSASTGQTPFLHGRRATRHRSSLPHRAEGNSRVASMVPATVAPLRSSVSKPPFVIEISWLQAVSLSAYWREKSHQVLVTWKLSKLKKPTFKLPPPDVSHYARHVPWEIFSGFLFPSAHYFPPMQHARSCAGHGTGLKPRS